MSNREEDVALLEAWCENRLDLLRFLARRLHCEATAKDIAQEIWFRFAKVRHDAPHKNYRALLFQIAANLAIDHRRAEHRRVELTARVNSLLWSRAEASAEHRTMAAQAVQQLASAVDQLPERCRDIFRMNRFEGLSQREIAERLGISVIAVEKHLRKAFAQLDREDISDDI